MKLRPYRCLSFNGLRYSGILLLAFLAVSVAGFGAPEEKPLVLVELFTSEGCSSCPPADHLLASFYSDQPFSGVTVVPLAFHVDYWDYIGWKDPFGDHANSLRQRGYAALWNENRVYTPQMVVNGVREFVGSDRKEAASAIDDGDSRPGARLTIRVDVKGQGEPLAVRVETGAKPGADDVLWIAIAEDDLSSDVTRGENKGKTLTHQGVVRSFSQYEPKDSAGAFTTTLPWNNDWNRAHCRIVAALQSKKSGAIHALGQLSLGASE